MNKKISELPKINELTKDDLFLLVQDKVSGSVDLSVLTEYIKGEVARQVFQACSENFLAKNGKAEDSAKLGGVDASRYALKSSATESGGASFEWAIPKMWLAEIPSDFDDMDDVPNMQGYMFCFGQTLRRELYPEMFSVIGLSYTRDADGNIVDDGKTFNLPDFRGRAPFGSAFGLASGFANEVGRSGGLSEIKLKAEQIPPHWHTSSYPVSTSQAVKANSEQISEGHSVSAFVKDSSNFDKMRTSKTFDEDSEITESNQETIQTLPPYLTINWIVKMKP